MEQALGLLETTSVALGVQGCDAMLKSGNVILLESRPTCPGKHFTLISGEVGAVRTAIAAGELAAFPSVVQTMIIPNVHPCVIPAFTGSNIVEEIEALGVIETYSLAACVEMADAAVKAAEIKLIEVRLGSGLAGKSFIYLTGTVGAVRSAVSACLSLEHHKGLVHSSIIIPSPHPDLIKAIL
ncbi:MAG: BMC domain-containing protein [Candidatus Hydrogenedentota bacterium]